MYTRTTYHSQRPEWRNTHKPGELFGIELETENRDGYTATLRALPDVNKYRPITETDGSLSGRGGVEIVFPPVKASTLRRKDSVFGRSLEALSQQNLRFHHDIGMHININITGWSTAHYQRLVWLINSMPSATLSNIGGRTLNSYCYNYTLCPYPYSSPPPGGFNLVDVMFRAYRSIRLAAVVRNDSRVEIRFPKSTTNQARISSIITFLEEAKAWARSSTDLSIPNVHNVNDVRSMFIEYLDSKKQTKRIRTMRQYARL